MSTNETLGMWVKYNSCFTIDDAKKPPVSYTVLTYSKQYMHNTKREDLTEGTGVVSAKYPLKVKLEFLTTLECQSG